MKKLEFLKTIIDEEFIQSEPKLCKELIDELVDSLNRKNELIIKMNSELQFYRKMDLIRKCFETTKI